MKLPSRLYAQHIGWTFKKHWQIQGKRIPEDAGAERELNKYGKKAKDVHAVAMSWMYDKPKVSSNCHHALNTYQESVNCYINRSDDFLLEGLRQAQVLTKTVEIKSLPKNLEELALKLQLSSIIDRKIHNIVLASSVLDAQQVKLRKKKLQDRPTINLPREYGISDERKSRLLVNRLLIECEKQASPSLTSRRNIMDQVGFKTGLSKNKDFLLFYTRFQKIITSLKPIDADKGVYDEELPNLFPLKYTISMEKQRTLTYGKSNPLSKSILRGHPHTIFTFTNKASLVNLHGTSITMKQFQSRTLLNAFIVATTKAKELYGDTFREAIPKPIVVQSIHTDGRTFHFGVFQLNTLDFDNDNSIKNYWFHLDCMDLYTNSGYKSGQPYIDDYNKNVFRYLTAFYNNE